VEAKRFPAFPGVAIAGNYQQHDQVATVGVHDHTENMIGSEVISRNLMSKAAPTARDSTSTAKMAPLVVSVSLVNIQRNVDICATITHCSLISVPISE
jgi:hypothetical protein